MKTLVAAIIAMLILQGGLLLAQPPDDNTLAYWRIDEGSGDFVEDSSANGNHGTVENATWTEDAMTGGAALEFNGQDARVAVADSPSLHPATGNITIGAWIKVFSDPTGWSNAGSIVHKQGAYQWAVNANGALWLGVWGARLESIGTYNFADHVDEWHHVAVAYDNGAQHAWIYVDGELNIDGAIGDSIAQTSDGIWLGYKQDGGTYFHGIIDEVRVSDVVRTQDEIITSMAGTAGFPQARLPEPEDGALYENTWANLSWRAGDFAVSHDVYIGTSFDDVNEGAADTFQGNQGAPTLVVGFAGFPIPDGLVPGTTYYWRIDEVNEADPNSPWKGDVWSFTVPPKTAYKPSPGDALTYVDPNTTLNWSPGFGAKLHSVYFGDDSEEVANATGAVPQAEITFSPGPLEIEKTYYWRVDEFDGTETHTGDVWSFTTEPAIPVHSDPDLVAWWTFDEAEGTRALDWSGNGNHVTLVSAEWSASSALGDSGVRINQYGAIEDLSYAADDLTEVSVTAWIRTNSSAGQYIVSFDRNEYYRLEIAGSGGGPGQVGWDVMTSTGQVDYGSLTRIDDDRWHHITGVFDNGTMTIYIDGAAEPTASGGPTFGSGNTRFGFIGANSEATAFNGSRGGGSPVRGLVDDIRIYHRALTPEEIQLVMRGDPLLAWNPSPADESMPDVDNALPLTWNAGDSASSHEVYFGTDEDAVANADTSDTTGIYRGRQNSTSFTAADGVEWGGGPYYWRVDENNADGTVTEGNVWSFTVADFLLVDDFESYTDNDAEDEAIWQTWVDGFGVPTNGSQVGYVLPPYAEQAVVNGGLQSMPLLYDNTGGVRNSEAVLPLTAPRDWTAHGVEILSLWYRGFPPSDGSFVQGLGGTFTMTGAGADIWGTSDEFHFAYKTLSGPGSIIARVDSIEETHVWAKAGVMIRETLDPDSKYAFAVVSAASGVAFQNRIDTGVSATGTTEEEISAPHWVKLERDAAGFFTVSHSTDGSSWNPVAGSIANNIPMASDVYIGLAVTSHNASEAAEVKFSNVTLTGNVGVQWDNQDIGIQANAAEPFYVSLSNVNGSPAVVTNSDADAAVTDEWTEWPIELSRFADQGINLSDVDQLAIGLGATGDPAAAGGSGTMFIDDIVLLRPAANEQP